MQRRDDRQPPLPRRLPLHRPEGRHVQRQRLCRQGIGKWMCLRRHRRSQIPRTGRRPLPADRQLPADAPTPGPPSPPPAGHTHHRHHRYQRQDHDQGTDSRRAEPPLPPALYGRQPEQPHRRAPHPAPPQARTRTGRRRDGRQPSGRHPRAGGDSRARHGPHHKRGERHTSKASVRSKA